MARLLVLAAISICSSIASVSLIAVTAAPRDPTGERAHYDFNRRRTSDIARSGSGDAYVVGQVGEEPLAYTVRLDYELRFRPTGRREGRTDIDIEERFFSREFLEELRASGHYQSSTFKISHLGFGDRSDANGDIYPECDILRFYDFEDEGDVRDLVIVAYVSYGLPVLGAVTMDLSGTWNGLDVRMGLDYRP